MFFNNKLVKLGKKKAVVDSRTLKLAKYLKPHLLPAPPAEVSWITKLAQAQPLPMYLNDELGDCVAAAAGHMIEQWNFYAGHPSMPSDAEILKTYEDVGGYIPGNPATDNGMDMLSYLKYWRSTGVGGHKIGAFLAINWLNLEEVRLAIQLLGNVYLGVLLPTWVQGLNAWTVPQGGVFGPSGQPGGWGGHCVPLVASSPETHTCITWGATLKMSHNFLQDYGEEAYAVLSQDWFDASGNAPSGLDMAQLKVDLAAL